MGCSIPGLPVPHHLLEFSQVHCHWIGDVIQPSHPLSPSSPLPFSLSQHQGLFQRAGCEHQVAKVLELGLEASSVWPEAETACKLRSESLGPLVRGCYVDAYRDDWDCRISARCKTSFWAFSTFHLSCESSWCLKIINDLLKGDHLEAAKRKGHPLLRHQDRGVCVHAKLLLGSNSLQPHER